MCRQTVNEIRVPVAHVKWRCCVAYDAVRQKANNVCDIWLELRGTVRPWGVRAANVISTKLHAMRVVKSIM